MDWPTIEEYRSALQHPDRAFLDARLQSCAIELNRLNQPRGRAGGFAIVYRLNNSSWSTAVRVFINPPMPERQARYQMVHDYLQQVRPRCLVDFGYDPEGILISGKGRFPIQTLEWVEGETLGEWLKGAVARGDSWAIKQMADAWVELVGELRTHKIAHGDLQHGNVMVRGGELVLVDYDCMFVPTMKTDKDRKAWEDGLKGYQHPKRPGQLLSPELDDFSAWVILIALRAVADDPGFWHKYIGGPGIENLLFTQDDMELPARSKLWSDLIQNARDRMVREWAERLRKSLDKPIDQVPPFNIDIFGPLRDVIATGDWRQIQELATGKKYASKTFPADVAPKVQEAIQRVDCFNQLQQKVRSGGIREIARAYRPELLDDWADKALVARGQAARAAIGVLEELERAEQSDRTGRSLVAVWDRRGKDLQGLSEGDDVRARVESWKKRIAAAQRLDQAIRQEASEQAIADAWKAVDDLKGHPDADRHRPRAELASHRLKLLATLAVPRGEDEAADREFLKAWDGSEKMLNGCREAEPFRTRAAAARERADRLAELKRRIDEADHARGGERAVIAASAALPPGYGADLAKRVEKARRRVAAAEALHQALGATPPSDLAIAAAAEGARSLGTWPSDPAKAARCVLAINRRDRLRTLDAIAGDLPLDEQDAQWVASWDAALLDDCYDARDHRTRYDQAVARIAAFAELERALVGRDTTAVRRLIRDPRLAGHPVLERRKAEIDELIATSERVDRLKVALQSGDSRAFLAEAEPGLLATHTAEFLPFRGQIEAWVNDLLRQGDILRATEPPFSNSATKATVVARWIWKQSRLVRTCLVASDPAKFLDRPEDARRGTQRLNPDMYRLEGGARLSVPEEWRRIYVTVWPVVDLGWARMTGPPLRIGPHKAIQDDPRSWFQRIGSWPRGLWERILNS
jgi:hypothetical protein